MGFTANDGTSHFLLIQLIWNLQSVIMGVWLTFIPYLKLFGQNKILCEFWDFLLICDIIKFYGSEMAEIYSIDYFGPAIYEIYRKEQCYGPVIIKL